MSDKPESIFDHNMTPEEVRAVLGWSYVDDERIAGYLNRTQGDRFLHHLAALYEYRGDEKKMQEYLDRCENQRVAKRLGFHYY